MISQWSTCTKFLVETGSERVVRCSFPKKLQNKIFLSFASEYHVALFKKEVLSQYLCG